MRVLDFVQRLLRLWNEVSIIIFLAWYIILGCDAYDLQNNITRLKVSIALKTKLNKKVIWIRAMWNWIWSIRAKGDRYMWLIDSCLVFQLNYFVSQLMWLCYQFLHYNKAQNICSNNKSQFYFPKLKLIQMVHFALQTTTWWIAWLQVRNYQMFFICVRKVWKIFGLAIKSITA